MEQTYKLELTKNELEELAVAIFGVQFSLRGCMLKATGGKKSDMETSFNTLETINNKIDALLEKTK